MSKHPVSEALLSGLAGATALTAVHQAAKYLTADAPRMDVLGRRAIKRGLEKANIQPPNRSKLQAMALAGDIISNSLFYSLVGAGRAKHPLLRGALLGTTAGLGAIGLPPKMGLGRAPRGLRPKTKAMTFAWYLIGGLAAAAAFKQFRRVL